MKTTNKNEFLEYLKKRRLYLEQLTGKLAKNKYRDDINLKVEKRNKSSQYIIYKKGKPSEFKYLKKSELDIARKLAQRDYEKQVMKAIVQELKCISKYVNGFPDKSYEDIYNGLSMGRKAVVTPIVLTDEQYAKAWQEEKFVGKKIQVGTVGFETQKGEIVRSKSEVIIADALYYANIPYHYEKPIKVGDRVIYPDFTVLNVKTRKEYYWEHLGMLDEEEYLNNTILKLELYEQNNIREGENLIISRETRFHPLNTSNVKDKIKHYLN
ncbi:MAG TPA: hypothetical protein DCW44_03900 [Eubacterium sp.]|nr:hypothetical protein [Eubacterium sp.]